jgi:hypothetical protein
MSLARPAGLLLAVAVIALSGCATHSATEPAAGVDLTGAWKLDPVASEDPQKVLDKMREEANKILDRRANAPPPPVQRPGMRGSQQQTPDQPEEDTPPPPRGLRGDPLLHSPMAHIIKEAVARGDFLTVHQGPDEFVLDYGTSRRSFTPGAHSVVSAEGGVGDQTSGWKGREYVIHIKGQMGPDVTEVYSLSADGKQLVSKLEISAGELPSVTLTRVYNPTREIAPRLLPNSD